MSSISTVDAEAIDYAVSQLEAFLILHKQRTREERRESLLLLGESLGLDTEVLQHLFTKLDTMWGKVTPFVLMGVLLGLRMAEYSDET